MPDNTIQQIKDRLDIVEVVSGYLKLEKTGINLRANCPFHQEKKPSFFVSPARQSFKCFGCFPAKSLIKTEKGFHSIEDIEIGQQVLTHKGRFMPVARRLVREYDGDLYSIKTRHSSEVTSLTADHKVFVIKTKNCPHRSRQTRICQRRCNKKYCPRFYLDYKVERLPVSQLAINDYLLYPINEQVEGIEGLDLSSYYNKILPKHGAKPRDLPLKIKLDEGFLKLLGYYIAEGSNHRAYLRFSLGGHEMDFAKEIQLLIKNIFSIDAGIHKRKGKKTGIEVSACNSKLANIFENLCGKHAQNKHIPFALQYLPPYKQRIILNAIFKGDGYKSKNAKTKNRYHKAITIISLLLAEQLRDILLRLNKTPSFYIQEAKTDKKGVNHKRSFTVQWQDDYKAHYSDFYFDDKNKVNYCISPVREIKKRQFKGDVYNLTVAKDHSYTATNFLVGNCGKGGDIFTFVQEIEGVEFGDALRLLAKRAGVKLKSFRPELQTKRQRLYQVCELAGAFFEKQLKASSQGKKARDYLLNRGLKPETIEKWRVGYAPDTWRALSDFLVGRGFSREEVVEAGLAVKPENPSHTPYDRFRGRIIFPVFDLHSQVVGFGGRVFGEDKEGEPAKYLNTSNTLLYDKSRALYGLNFGKLSARQKNFIILTEGYLDVILSQQAGFLNTVAASGTSLTIEQLKLIKRYTNNLLTGFDMDRAGDLATQRGIDLALSQDFQVKVIAMPQGKDPADIASESPAEWLKLVESAKEIMDFYFITAHQKFDNNSPQGKKEMAQFLLPKIKQVSNNIVQSHWLQKLANSIKVSQEAVSAELKKLKPKQTNPAFTSQTGPSPRLVNKVKSRKDLLEERLLSLCWQSPRCLSQLDQQIIENCSKTAREILFSWQKQKPEESADLEVCLTKLTNKGPEFKALLDNSLFRAENAPEENPAEEIRLCSLSLARLCQQNELAQLSSQIAQAEGQGEPKKLQILMEQFNQLSQQNYGKTN